MPKSSILEPLMASNQSAHLEARRRQPPSKPLSLLNVMTSSYQSKKTYRMPIRTPKLPLNSHKGRQGAVEIRDRNLNSKHQYQTLRSPRRRIRRRRMERRGTRRRITSYPKGKANRQASMKSLKKHKRKLKAKVNCRSDSDLTKMMPS